MANEAENSIEKAMQSTRKKNKGRYHIFLIFFYIDLDNAKSKYSTKSKNVAVKNFA